MQKKLLCPASILLVCSASYLWVDVPLAHWTTTLSEPVAIFFESVTDFGHSTKFILAGFFGFVLFRFLLRIPRAAAASALLFLGITVPGAILNGLKISVGRYRPHELLDKGLGGFAPFTPSYDTASFPSGHSCTVFALAAVAATVDRRLTVPAYLAASILAISRVALQRHYLSDVIFGAAMGLAFTLFIARHLRQWGLDPAAPQATRDEEPRADLA